MPENKSKLILIDDSSGGPSLKIAVDVVDAVFTLELDEAKAFLEMLRKQIERAEAVLDLLRKPHDNQARRNALNASLSCKEEFEREATTRGFAEMAKEHNPCAPDKDGYWRSSDVLNTYRFWFPKHRNPKKENPVDSRTLTPFLRDQKGWLYKTTNEGAFLKPPEVLK